MGTGANGSGGGRDRRERREREREHHIGAVHIDGSSIFRQMTRMSNTLIRIEAELKASNEARARFEKDTEEDLEKLDNRVAPLERRVWAFPSLSALIGLGALVVSIIAVL